MNAKEERLMWRRAQAAKVREERTITAYIQAKHPEIYSKAATFYNQLNKRYPNKSDLRKVKEFQALLSANPVQPSKYHKKEYPNITVNVGPVFTDSLQLRIPLLSAEDTLAATTTPIQSPEITTTPEPAQFCVIEEATAMSDPVQFGEMDDDIINKIVADLQKDPDIQNIFDDMDLEEVTPLEAELLLW